MKTLISMMLVGYLAIPSFSMDYEPDDRYRSIRLSFSNVITDLLDLAGKSSSDGVSDSERDILQQKFECLLSEFNSLSLALGMNVNTHSLNISSRLNACWVQEKFEKQYDRILEFLQKTDL